MSTVKSLKPMRFSKTDAPGFAARPGLSGRPRALPERLFRVPSAAAELEEPVAQLILAVSVSVLLARRRLGDSR